MGALRKLEAAAAGAAAAGRASEAVKIRLSTQVKFDSITNRVALLALSRQLQKIRLQMRVEVQGFPD